MERREYWRIIKPFKVINYGRFKRMADKTSFAGYFKCNQAGFAYCPVRAFETERRPVESLYQLLQQHLPPREYVMVRIEAHTDDSDGHTRYERIYRDRIEAAVYSEDPRHRR